MRKQLQCAAMGTANGGCDAAWGVYALVSANEPRESNPDASFKSTRPVFFIHRGAKQLGPRCVLVFETVRI